MTGKQEDLPSVMYDLAEKALEIAPSDGQNAVKTTQIPHLKREYRVPGDDLAGNPVFRTTEEEINKDGVGAEVHREVYEELQSTDIYEDALSMIEDRDFQTHTVPSPESAIISFISSILNNAEEGIDKRDITRIVSIFTTEIDGSAIYWSPNVWLVGLSLGEKDNIQLSEEISLRKPEKEDLVEEISLKKDSLPGRRAVGMPERAPTAILEFNERGENRQDIYEYIQIFISVLQLFDVGSVSSMKTDFHCKSVLRPFLIPGNYLNQDTPFEYVLDDSKVDNLSDFYHDMNDVVESNLLDNEKNNYLSISFDRYENAIKENNAPESQLTSAIMALEAMLLKNEEKGELSERLSRRADILLGMFDHQSIEVSKKIKEAYKIRSRYVHGSETERDYNEDLVYDIVDYARACLVIQLILSDDYDKKTLLNKIDNSSVQIESRESLEENIDEITPEWVSQI